VLTRFEDARAVIALVRSTPGVVDVVDELTFGPHQEARHGTSAHRRSGDEGGRR
jgi:hypothetical protein